MRTLTSALNLSILFVSRLMAPASARALTLCLLVWLTAGQASAAVLAAKGDIQSLSDSPASVVLDVSESDDWVAFFREQRNYELPADLDVDIVDPGRVNGDLPLSPGIIPAGTRVDSYFLHCDPETSKDRWKGTVTFDREILGIVVRTARLIDTNDELGALGTSYETRSVLEYQAEDVVELHSDRHSVSIDWFSTIGVDQIRVITRGTPGFNYLANFMHKIENEEGSYIEDSIKVDHPFTTDHPDVLLFATPIHSSYSGGMVWQLESPLAMRVTVPHLRWMIRTTDGSDLPLDQELAVLVVAPSSDAYLHTATDSNVFGNYTVLDHPLLNGNPDARLLVAPRDIYVAAPLENLGVWYNGSRWSIFLQDNTASMPVRATFQVRVLPDAGTSFVHTVTEEGETRSYVDDPRLNGKGLILPHVTQVWNPGGGLGVYNDHLVQMVYDARIQQWAVQNADTATIPAGSSFNIFVPPTPSFAFEHRAAPANSIGQVTFVEHELLDGSPAPILLETPNLAPREGAGVPNPRPTGLYLERESSPETWGIFNQDAWTSYPAGAVSNLFQPPMDLRSWVHEAAAENIENNWTDLRHSGADLESSSIVFVTQQWEAPTESNHLVDITGLEAGEWPSAALVGGVYNDHNIGVWWNEAEQVWSVFNQDRSPMPVGATFNVFAANEYDNGDGYLSENTAPVDPGEVAFVHVASADTLDGDRSVIDHRWLNAQPDLQLIVTQNWNPGGAPGVYNDHPIAVDYDPDSGKWSIVNQDGADMPENAAFNVLPVGARPTPEIVITPPRRPVCGLGFEGGLAVVLWAALRRRRQRALSSHPTPAGEKSPH
jgi:hypothetical protein